MFHVITSVRRAFISILKVAKQPHRRDVVESPSYSYPMPDDFPYAALDLETMAGFPSDFPPLVEDIFNQHPLPPTTTPSTDESSDAAFFGVLETNVTTSVGETAFLRCRVQNNKHQVSQPTHFNLYYKHL